MVELFLREPALSDEVHRLASKQGKDVEEILASAVRLYLALYRQRRIRQETEAWYAMPIETRRQYTGRFVAICEGQIVDSDPDQMTLFYRIRQKHQRDPVAIVEGGEQSMPEYVITSVKHTG
jgi:hypothetical protein